VWWSRLTLPTHNLSHFTPLTFPICCTTSSIACNSVETVARMSWPASRFAESFFDVESGFGETLPFNSSPFAFALSAVDDRFRLAVYHVVHSTSRHHQCTPTPSNNQTFTHPEAGRDVRVNCGRVQTNRVQRIAELARQLYKSYNTHFSVSSTDMAIVKTSTTTNGEPTHAMLFVLISHLRLHFRR
jgi:hypothetical protein